MVKVVSVRAIEGAVKDSNADMFGWAIEPELPKLEELLDELEYDGKISERTTRLQQHAMKGEQLL